MNPIASLLLAIILLLPFSTAAQTGRGTAVHACSFLTKALVAEHTPLTKQAFALVSDLPPSEDAIAPSGSECTYGGVTFNIDAISPEYFERIRKPEEWKAITGVGDTAYFRDNAGRFAELFVRTGMHSFSIQMDVPTGRTSASIQPNVIALAKAILPKVK
jgi:hypothetical protein